MVQKLPGPGTPEIGTRLDLRGTHFLASLADRIGERLYQRLALHDLQEEIDVRVSIRIETSYMFKFADKTIKCHAMLSVIVDEFYVVLKNDGNGF